MTTHARTALVAAAAAAALLAAPALAAPRKTPELVAKGKASYEENCASCHGAKGRGDGEAAAALQPRPADLAKGRLEHGATAEKLHASISNGVPGTAMIAFADLPDEERWALAYYVLELRGAKGAGAKAAPKRGKGTTGPEKR